jgi:hypothetical protein
VPHTPPSLLTQQYIPKGRGLALISVSKSCRSTARQAWEVLKAHHEDEGQAFVGVREILARHIFESATDGERDLVRLPNGALARLGKQHYSASSTGIDGNATNLVA